MFTRELYAKDKYLRIFDNKILGKMLKKDDLVRMAACKSLCAYCAKNSSALRIMKRSNLLRSKIRSIAHKDENKASRVYIIALHFFTESGGIL